MNRAGEDVWIRVDEAGAVGEVRRAATALAEAAGFDAERVGQVAVAVTEAVSNLVKHAVRGTALTRRCPGAPDVVELITVDRGPGMPDVARAMRDGYSTSGTLGVGLGAITRLASAYDVHSLPGKGTLLAVQFAAHRPLAPQPASGLTLPAPDPAHPASGLARPVGGEAVADFAIAAAGPATTVLVCHAPDPGTCREVVQRFLRAPGDDPPAILRRLREELPTIPRPLHEPPDTLQPRDTPQPPSVPPGNPRPPGEPWDVLGRRDEPPGIRSCAVAIARVTPGRVSYAGLGDISGWIVYEDRRLNLVPTGAADPGVRQHDHELGEQATVVLHTGGLMDRWSPSALPGLFSRSPAVIAAGLLREAGSPRDDACVVVVRPRRDSA